jgi:hypothetical protein
MGNCARLRRLQKIYPLKWRLETNDASRHGREALSTIITIRHTPKNLL